jgi:hypothetical protein
MQIRHTGGRSMEGIQLPGNTSMSRFFIDAQATGTGSTVISVWYPGGAAGR